MNIDENKMQQLDPGNMENLKSMWSVFSRCANLVEEGRRLENLSWRLWSQETLCCESQPRITSTSLTFGEGERLKSENRPHAFTLNILLDEPRNALAEPFTSSRRREGRSTSLSLEQMVISIHSKKPIEPLSQSITQAIASISHSVSTPRSNCPLQNCMQNPSDRFISTATSSRLILSEVPQAGGSKTIQELVKPVRGFSPGLVMTSHYLHTHRTPTPITTQSLMIRDESLFEEKIAEPSYRSSFLTGIERNVLKKHTSFKDEAESRTITNNPHQDEDVFGSGEKYVSESAIDDDEDSSDWEDSATDSDLSSVTDNHLFQRIDSRLELSSRPSLLTIAIHEPEHAAIKTPHASKSRPFLRGSKRTSPNGSPLAIFLDTKSAVVEHVPEVPGARHINNPTTETHALVHSPKTTRSNMLKNELSESLRKELLWEREKRITKAAAILKQRQTADEVATQQRISHTNDSDTASKNGSWNDDFQHYGLSEYHRKGW